MSRDGSNPSERIAADDLRARQAGPLDRDIGERIRKHRQDRRLSFQQLGGMLGLSGQQMRKYELGQSRISASTLYVIAQILDVPIGQLLPDDGRMRDPGELSIREITTKLSAIKDARFLMAMSSFISTAVDYTRTDI
jgi:transcriptional regulator with XRE-family HTH domain